MCMLIAGAGPAEWQATTEALILFATGRADDALLCDPSTTRNIFRLDFSWSASHLCSGKDVLRGLPHLNYMMVVEINPSKGITSVAVASHVGDLLDVDELLYIVDPR